MALRRKRIRLTNYDYSQDGFYFITIATQKRIPYFGSIQEKRNVYSPFGFIAENCLKEVPIFFPYIHLDEYIIMPDHIHLIFQIKNESYEIHDENELSDISEFRKQSEFRRVLINQDPTVNHNDHIVNRIDPTVNPNLDQQSINKNRNSDKSWILMKWKENHIGKVVRHFKAKTSFLIHKSGEQNFAWVSRYYDHIIRNKRSLENIRMYIRTNPRRHSNVIQ